MFVTEIRVTNLQVTSPTARTLNITWAVSESVDQFEVTYNYTIKRCFETGPSAVVTISDGSLRSYTLRNLSEDSTYTITIRAIRSGLSGVATTTADTQISGEHLYLKQNSF